MKNIRRQVVIAAALLAAAQMSGSALAQAYPSKPITIVVAYPAGGDTDAMARLYAEKLGQRLGQPVVVDNRPGASGTLGSSHVAKAAPDGYTLLLAPNTFAFAQSVLKISGPAAYDVLNGFTPIVQTCTMPMFIAAAGSSGIKDLSNLVTQAKGKELTFASPGNGSPMHVLGEMFARNAGIRLTHIPYKGVAPAVNDMLGGHVPLTVMPYGPIGPYAGGKIRMLAVMDTKRSPLAPQIPTMAEQGFQTQDGTAWQGIFGPKGMPADVVNLLNSHFNEILKQPDVVAKMAVFVALPAGGAAAQLAKTNADDHQRFTKIIKDLGIRGY